MTLNLNLSSPGPTQSHPSAFSLPNIHVYELSRDGRCRNSNRLSGCRKYQPVLRLTRLCSVGKRGFTFSGNCHPHCRRPAEVNKRRGSHCTQSNSGSRADDPEDGSPICMKRQFGWDSKLLMQLLPHSVEGSRDHGLSQTSLQQQQQQQHQQTKTIPKTPKQINPKPQVFGL